MNGKTEKMRLIFRFQVNNDAPERMAAFLKASYRALSTKRFVHI